LNKFWAALERPLQVEEETVAVHLVLRVSVRTATGGADASVGGVEAEKCFLPWLQVDGVFGFGQIMGVEVAGGKGQGFGTIDCDRALAVSEADPFRIAF